jgi:hypothetical protein
MTRTDCASVGLCLLAAFLLDVTAPRISLAEESGSAAHDGAGSNSAGEPSSSRPPSGENVAGGAGKSAPENRDSDRIDTRITVQPRGPAVGRDYASELKAKVRSWAASHLRPHSLSAPEPSGGGVVRNAIGMSVGRHEDLKRRDGEPHGLRPAAQIPAVAAGVTQSGDVDRPPIVKPNAGPTVSPAASSRGAINGTSLTRPGHAPSGVGGPAKAVAGISGTTIRPKQ